MTWDNITGGRVLYDTTCGNCGGLMMEWQEDTLKEWGRLIQHPTFTACPNCELPAEFATRLGIKGEFL